MPSPSIPSPSLVNLAAVLPATPQANLSADVIEVLTKRTQDGGTEVVEAKAGKGSTTLSMAYAGVTFADACLKGLNGVPNVVECSFVQSTIKSTITELPFFASKVRLGKNGIKGVLGLGPMTDFEVYPTAPSVYEPIQPTFRPLSPHLPIYKPQTSSTVSITNRISAIILTTVPLSYAFLTLKVGPICLANESVYQALHYASKLGPISLQITALAAVYHLVHGIHDVYLLFK